MKQKLLVLGLCSILFLTAGCGQVAKLKNGQEVVAKLDGKTITTEDLYDELKKQGGSSVLINMIDSFIANKEIETDETAKQYAESQLEQTKQYYESAGQDFETAMKSAGYKNESEYKDVLILEYKKNKVVENYLKDQLTDDEIQSYYDTDIFGDLTVRHILISPEVTDDMTDEEKSKAEEKAKKEAEDIIKKLDKGEDFAELAKKYSDDEGTKENGGLLSDFSKDSVVSEFWDASYKLKKNEYSKEPVKSDYGYHVILKVDSKSKPKLDEVIDEIKTTLVENKLSNDTTLSAKTWADIRKKYKLDIQDSELKSGYDSYVDAQTTVTQ